MRLAPRLYADLIGKPYSANARGPEAFDCLGLALELQRRQGHQLADYASTAEEFALRFNVGVLGPCIETPWPVPGCAVLFRMLHDTRHIGTMIDRWSFLHTLEGRAGGAGIERLLDVAWQRRVIGFYSPAVQA